MDWIDRFSTEMNDNRELSEPSKKELLKLIIEKISVEYDTNQMIHILTIFFKIPVFIQEGNDVNMKTSRVSVTPPKAGRKAKNQIESVETYSTVTKPSSLARNVSASKGYSLRVSVELKSSNLWSPPYSPYQQELFGIITKFHEDDGLNFKQISDWLVANQYLTSRGKTFTQSHCWSIYKKKNSSIERFSREYAPIIKDMSIDVVNYVPLD